MSRKQQKPNEERVLEMDTSEPNDGKEKDAYAQLLHLKNVTKLEKESQILEEQKKLLQTLGTSCRIHFLYCFYII